MARDVFGFVKIRLHHGKKGRNCVIMSCVSIGCLLLFLIISAFMKGNTPWFIGTLSYCSFLLGIYALYRSLKLQSELASIDRYTTFSLYLSIAAIVFHLVVFFIGIMAAIM